MTSLSVLEIKSLTAGYPHKPLLKNLSLKLQEPAFVAVIGHNGCGKSTFFRSLIGQHPFEGDILLQGKNITTIPNLSSRGIITLLEQKNSVNFSIPVLDLVVMGSFRKKSVFDNYNYKDYQAAEKALSELGLSGYAKEDFLKLSGGEQQLVWLAQVMVQNPGIILLDEPTQQLDVYNKKKVFSLMMDWVKQHHKTVFCITHDLGNLKEMEGYLLNLGRKSPVLETLSDIVVENNLRILEEKLS